VTAPEGHGPGVKFPPPLVFVAGFVVGWVLERYVHPLWPSLSTGSEWRIEVFAAVLLIGGVTFSGWGMATFHRANTAIFPNRDASLLVTAGPYRFTRNPMYTGLVVAYLGVSLLWHVGWAVVLLPLPMLAIYRFVIRREERYLTAAFGDQYREYQSRVRRWI
jgi:protein-S-isoprenylcysteine O-methyltransferase Ste14